MISAHHIHMVALIFVSSSSLCTGDTRRYKVRDSNEEYVEPSLAKEYARNLEPDDDSIPFYGAGFHFPDFFNDGNKDGDGGNFGAGSLFGSPFPGESRSSDSSYIVPAGTYRTLYNVKPNAPISRSHTPGRGEYRQKNPILTLYDDWSPDEQPRNKWSPDDQTRNTKWSQAHTDDDSGEAPAIPVGPYKGQLSGQYRGTGSYNRPYSEASLKQHYKPINPPGKTHLGGDGDVRTHTHKYGVNHVYDRKKKPEELNYDQHDEKLNNRKPQQFSSDPNPHRNERPRRPSYQNEYRSQSYPSEYSSQSYPSEYRSQSYPKEFRNRNFSPSPPDYFGNSRNFDFFTDSSNTAPKKVKATDSDSSGNSERAEDYERQDDSERPEDAGGRSNDQLDKSCEKSNKSTTINLSDGQISLQCYDCYDTHHKRPYEQCVQVPDEDERSNRKKRSVKSGSVVQNVPAARGKRQHDDYYDGDGNYGPDSSDYRFGPEHFTDEDPSTYNDEGEEVNPDYESEKCHKSRKGDMLCISCENKNTGGTYEQCSYASDPKKNSYERSMSKAFGSPRLPDENRRKQVEGMPRKASVADRKAQRGRGIGTMKPLGSPRGNSRGPGYSSGAGSYDDGPTLGHSPPFKKKAVGGSYGSNGQNSKYRGSQGRPPLPPPARRTPRDRSLTPASTSLKGPPRMGLVSNLKTTGRSNYLPKRNPPPGSRAYSTPSPIGPDPYSFDFPDPYNPDLGEGGAQGSRNRKNIDASFEPGYDETFAGLFPELVDADPSSAVALAPPSYDEEYSDETYSDYDDVPVRRRDEDNTQNGSRIHSMPSVSRHHGSLKRKPDPEKHRICKRIRKNKMTCLQCVDEKGAKQEECTYEAETDPKSRHMNYREVKEMMYEPSGQNPERVEREDSSDRNKRKFKKYNPDERYSTKNINLVQKPDTPNDRIDRRNNTSNPETSPLPNRHRKETREKREDPDSPEEKVDAEIERPTRKNYNPIPTDPPELDDFGEKMSEDGEFSADTEMKFDPALGMSLPKYMLDKSEGEAIFDEVLASSYKDQ